MKKLFVIVALALITLCSCSQATNEEQNGFTLRAALQAFKDEGVELIDEEKPHYELVNAKDGAIFFYENEIVKIYEFDSEHAYERGVEELTVLGEFPKRELLVIETNSKKAIDIFNKTADQINEENHA